MKSVILFLVTVLMVAFVITPALSQTSNSYDLTWNVISSGGGTLLSGNGQYSLSGTVGQPGTMLLTGGSYSLQSGFWASSSSIELYLPFVQR